jgi:Ca-activated chloride channel family protein
LDYVRDEQGNVVKSHLNEELLQQIAGAAGGFYLPLRGAKTVDTLYEKGLAPLPKSESKERLVKRYHERFYWPLALAILLLLVETLFPERKRAPRAGIVPAASGRPALTAALSALLMLSPAALASPATALHEYRAGKYEDALKEYRQLLERKTDDPRLRFNAGAAAYRDGQFNEAAKHFGDVLAAPDLQLQQHAYYNLGNTFYQIGQGTADPGKKAEAWEKALKDYESTLKLNPQDADTTFNHEFVKKKLEELKQQQQQQQQQNQDNKDQKQDQNKQDQQQQQQQQQNQQDQQKDKSQPQQKEAEQKQQEQQQQTQKDQKQDSQQAQAQKDQQDKQEDRSASQQPDEKSSGETNRTEQAAAYAAGQMTPQQARQLLDAQKAEEAMIPIKPEGKPIPANRPFKDW